ncbi:hypothetical protein BVX94_01460 [bacterium B17]|nr:hypothetical protein BVX94_01460 [bacterium B17]
MGSEYLSCMRIVTVIVLACMAIITAGCGKKESSSPYQGYAGSRSCKECHERFYHLWEPSHHGKAMQPYTDTLATNSLTPQSEPIAIGDVKYMVDISPGKGFMIETKGAKQKKYKIEHAMGGKNVFFFLTPMERGRLQVMPLSYNINTREWYDTTASMVRHFNLEEDEAIHWTDPLLTFNTACFNCHVSQLTKNYDFDTDTYKTVWLEPGINCEACHGPAEEHNRVCREAMKRGEVPKDLKILSWKDLTVEQKNDACAVCHAKMGPLTPKFITGDRLFDHYDLVCMEDRDYYPDGRDLGENYTQTSWMMSPCVKSGKLDCTYCHTSSGRFRFKDKPNNSCMPCHKERVANIKTHTHHSHKEDNSPSCVSCHMPMTEFGRMNRSDHSMRPPSPAASIEFGSPNACIICHSGKKPEWAAELVKKWHPDQKWTERIISEGRLVQWARDEKWGHLPEILEYIQAKDSDEIVVTSLIRLLYSCRETSKRPAIKQALENKSPLVRAAAVTTIGGYDMDAVRAILPRLDDEYRLVRIRAANSLQNYPRDMLPPDSRKRLEEVEKELMTSMTCRPDHWGNHYNLGNYWIQRGEAEKGLESLETAIRMRPDVIIPYVNASIALSQMGNPEKAYTYLRKAYSVDPDNGTINFNLGLLMAERKDMISAEKHLRKALKDNSVMPQAAYNLAVIVGARNPAEAATLCEKALKATPGNEKYKQAMKYYKNLAERY